MPNDAGLIPADTSAPAAEPTLRETITANLAEVTKQDTTETAAPETTGTPDSGPSATESPVAAAHDGRARNPDGTFAKGEAAPKEPATQATATPPAATPAVEPVVAAPKMPSSWKKEMQPHWDKLPREVQEEAARRESDYSRGVSQHKQVADRAKPLDDAVAPYRELLRQNGMDEAQTVKRLLDTHHALSMGQPQQRVDIINSVIADYKMPVRLATQNAQGEWQLVDAAQPRPVQQPAPQQPQDPRAIVREELQNLEVSRQLSDFVNAKDASGTPLHPHYDRIKGDMALILERAAQSGEEIDLKGAYDKAKRLHDDIWQAEQRATAEADAARKAAEAKAKVARARSSAVSVVSSTPSGNMVANADKSLRDQLTDNLREVVGGRI